VNASTSAGGRDVRTQAADTRAHVDTALLIIAKVGLLLVLVMPLVVTRDTFFPFVVGKALYSRVLIEIAFAAWIVLAVRNASYRPVLSRLMIAFAVYLVVSLIASLAGVSPQRSIWSTYERMQGVVDLAHWVAFALVLTSMFRTRQDWRHVLNLSLLIGMVMALMGAAVMVGWELPVYDFLEAGQRIELTLGNPTYVGAYMLINALIGAGLFVDSFTDRTAGERGGSTARRRRRRRTERRSVGTASNLLWWRVFWAVAVGLSLWMMLESSTRGAFVGLVGALAAAAVGYVLWGRLRRLKIVAAVMIVGIVSFGLFLVLGAETAAAQRLAERSYVVERFIQAGQGNDTSLKGRLASVSFGLRGFAEKPLLGWGPENYVVAWGRHYDAEEVGDYRGPPFDQAHNKPIEELTTKGAVGLASYLTLWVLMLWTISSRVRRLGADREVLTLVMGAAMVGYFAQNLFLFDTPTTVLQFVVLLGFAVSLDTTYDGMRKTSQGVGWIGRSAAAVLDRLRVRDLGTRAARNPAVGWACAAVLAVLVGMTVYMGNVRVYQAAIEANSAVVRQGPTWSQRLDHFERSMDLFSPLANYPRQYMLTSLNSAWDALPSAGVVARAMDMVDRAAVEIEASEPEWWAAYVNLAAVYQNAASLDPSYAEVARGYVETAEKLAPETPGVVVIKARQEKLEETQESPSGP
jgi:O-antigen ligase